MKIGNYGYRLCDAITVNRRRIRRLISVIITSRFISREILSGCCYCHFKNESGVKIRSVQSFIHAGWLKIPNVKLTKQENFRSVFGDIIEVFVLS